VALLDRVRQAVAAARRDPPAAPEPVAAEALRRIEDVSSVLGRVETSLAELARRVDEVQQLTGRVYEQAFDYRGRVASLRADDSYAAAYEPDPLVSVVIPTFNRAELLCERGLASVLRQSYGKLEVIVVGNACTDDTVERVNAIGDPRVQVVNLAFQEPEPEDDTRRWHNSGTVPFNHGLTLATGSWIAMQHDDDEWDSDYVERMLAAARETRAEIVYCPCRVFESVTKEPLDVDIGEFPPRLTQFATQFSIFHSGLRYFGYDRVCALMNEPNDWNFGRRLWDAGVRFHLVPDTLGSYYFRRDEWLSRNR
jgi:glycosyltransferase involved in cell wall biosynthesis